MTDERKPVYLDREEIRQMISEEIANNVPTSVDLDRVVRTSVDETLLRLGVDAKRPLDLQQDMAFLRDMRDAHQRIRTKGVLVIVGLFISTLAAVAWLGVKAALSQH